MIPQRKKQYLIATSVVLLAIIVGGVLLANNRTANLQAAVIALQTLPTFHVKAELTLHLPPRLQNRQRPFTTITSRVEGDVQRLSTGTPELTGQLFVGATGPGAELYADGDLRIFDNQVAFRLDQLSPLFNPTGSLVNKWTYVDAPLLQTKNTAEVATTLTRLLESLTYQGSESLDGATVSHYTGVPTPAVEEELITVLNKQASGNQAYHVLARLLQANDIKQLDMYSDPDTHYPRRVSAIFVQPSTTGSGPERARVTLDFSDFGKAVALDRPQKQLTVRSDVFGKIFGSGEISPQ